MQALTKVLRVLAAVKLFSNWFVVLSNTNYITSYQKKLIDKKMFSRMRKVGTNALKLKQRFGWSCLLLTDIFTYTFLSDLTFSEFSTLELHMVTDAHFLNNITSILLMLQTPVSPMLCSLLSSTHANSSSSEAHVDYPYTDELDSESTEGNTSSYILRINYWINESCIVKILCCPVQLLRLTTVFAFRCRREP